MKKEERVKLLKYLKTQTLTSLATFGKEPWICSVYFVVDDDLNFYFVSSPDSQHSKDIEKNKSVA